MPDSLFYLLIILKHKIMDDFTFLNLILGPLGESFKIIKQRGKLYSEEDFVELTETQYALYVYSGVNVPSVAF